jgi:hypothetical protein
VGAVTGPGAVGSGLGVVRGIQLGQGHGSRSGATGASTCQHTCCGGSGVGSSLVARVVMSQLVNGHIKAKCTVGSGLPSILIRTVGGTGGGGGGLGVVRGIQLGESHGSRAGATGASAC